MEPRTRLAKADTCLTMGMRSSTITTMKQHIRNPNIRVTPRTRQDLKIIAAHTQETMLEVVARLAKQERERIQNHAKGL